MQLFSWAISGRCLGSRLKVCVRSIGPSTERVTLRTAVYFSATLASCSLGQRRSRGCWHCHRIRTEGEIWWPHSNCRGFPFGHKYLEIDTGFTESLSFDLVFTAVDSVIQHARLCWQHITEETGLSGSEKGLLMSRLQCARCKSHVALPDNVFNDTNCSMFILYMFCDQNAFCKGTPKAKLQSVLLESGWVRLCFWISSMILLRNYICLNSLAHLTLLFFLSNSCEMSYHVWTSFFSKRSITGRITVVIESFTQEVVLIFPLYRGSWYFPLKF